MNSPLLQFQNIYNVHLSECNLVLPSACCFSTIGLDGYPNSRFVSLKKVSKEGFIITGPLNSRKGIEVKNNNKVALSFWWESIMYQIRIQGETKLIDNDLAITYFNERSRDAQLISLICNQGKTIKSYEQLQRILKETSIELKKKTIQKPESWGALLIKPIRIEFLKFEHSRLHKRELFVREDNNWVLKILQP